MKGKTPTFWFTAGSQVLDLHLAGIAQLEYMNFRKLGKYRIALKKQKEITHGSPPSGCSDIFYSNLF